MILYYDVLGLQTDYLCRWPNDDLPLRYRVVDVAFMLFFTLEVYMILYYRILWYSMVQYRYAIA